MKFMDNLASMGYPQSWRESTLQKALIGYMKVLSKVQKGETRRNRLAKCSEMSRRYKRLCGQTNWYREETDENEVSETPMYRRQAKRKTRDTRRIESIIFIPLTRNGKLKAKLTEQE